MRHRYCGIVKASLSRKAPTNSMRPNAPWSEISQFKTWTASPGGFARSGALSAALTKVFLAHAHTVTKILAGNVWRRCLGRHYACNAKRQLTRALRGSLKRSRFGLLTQHRFHLVVAVLEHWPTVMRGA